MSIKKLSLLGILVIAVTVIPYSVGLAITNGQPDGNGHPYVGAAIQLIPNNPGAFRACSGSVITERKFLTAAHCFRPDWGPVLVSFKSGPPFSLADFTPGTVYLHPDWCIGCGPGLPGIDTHDVAVVVLGAPVNPGGFATLPSPGLVDSLSMNTEIDLVGYGLQGFVFGGGPPTDLFLMTRYFAPSLLIDSNHVYSSEFIRLTANPAEDRGGVCRFDSGGPSLLGGTNIVLAVNFYMANDMCAGMFYSNRVDLPDILDFINGVPVL